MPPLFLNGGFKMRGQTHPLLITESGIKAYGQLTVMENLVLSEVKDYVTDPIYVSDFTMMLVLLEHSNIGTTPAINLIMEVLNENTGKWTGYDFCSFTIEASESVTEAATCFPVGLAFRVIRFRVTPAAGTDSSNCFTMTITLDLSAPKSAYLAPLG